MSNSDPQEDAVEYLSGITTPPGRTNAPITDASGPFAGTSNSQYQSTPHKSRANGYTSANYTHASLDSFLIEDLKSHARRSVPLNDYLRAIFELDSNKWDRLIEEWKFHESPEYRKGLDEYKSAGPELRRYKPFASWVASIVDAAKEKFQKEMQGVKMNFRPLGRKVIEGSFGDRLPDVFCTDSDKPDDDLEWGDGYAVFEFKRKPGKDQEKPTEKEAGSGSKRKQTTQDGSAGKKMKVSGTGDSGGKVGSGSRAAAAKGSATRAVQSTSATAKRSGSGSKLLKNQVPTVPGYNSRDSPEADVFNMTSETTTMDTEVIASHPLALRGTCTNAEVQLGNYAAQMMSAVQFREWVIGILVDEDKMTLWYYDRSRAFCTSPVRFKEDGVSFIKIILALSLGSRSGKQFGFDDFLKKDTGTRSTDPESDNYRYLDFDGTGFKQVREEDGYGDENSVPRVGLSSKSKIRINLAEQVHRQFTLFGRGTRIEQAEVGEMKDGVFSSTSRGTGLVLKMSYQVVTRRPEYEIIEEARKVNPVNTPALLAWARVERRLPGDELEDVCEKPEGDAYEKRVLVVLLLRKYKHAWNLRGKVFMDVIKQGVICHRQLLVQARILHRDLSPQNILYYKEKNGRYRAVLNDYDLSVILEVNKGTPGASSKHRTGTAPFMARELLEELPEAQSGETPIQMNHVYAYELESWMYIMLFIMLGYTSLPPEGNDILKPWRSRHWSTICDQKKLFLTGGYVSIIRSANIAPEHLSSRPSLRNAILLFGRAETAAQTETNDPSRPEPTPVQTWRIRHRRLVWTATYRSFCEAIGVSEEDIQRFDDDPLSVDPNSDPDPQ